MSAVTQTKRLTAEEFFRLPEPADGTKQELVRGVIVTTPPTGFQHGEIQSWIAYLLLSHVKPLKLGRVTVESGVITERDDDTVRGPDVSFWSNERIPPGTTPEGYPDVAADLCVEVRSPKQSKRGLRQKAAEYLAAGVRMVWIVDPHEQTVTVYRTASEGRVLSDEAEVSGEDVVPGFTCRVARFFE